MLFSKIQEDFPSFHLQSYARMSRGYVGPSNVGEYNLYSFKKDDCLFFIPFLFARLSASYLVKGWRMASFSSLSTFHLLRSHFIITGEGKIIFSHHLCSIEYYLSGGVLCNRRRIFGNFILSLYSARSTRGFIFC